MPPDKIYLCVKQHSITGLKYFCKTIRERYNSYKGSGTYWKSHLRKHGGEHVVTLETFEFDNQDEASKFALWFSRQHNIVQSNEWANLREENALDGGVVGFKHTEEQNRAKSERQKGKSHNKGCKHSEEANRAKAERSKIKNNLMNFQKSLSKKELIRHAKKASHIAAKINMGNTYQGKYWDIQFPDGEIKTIKKLKHFCQENNIGLWKFHHGKEVNGYKLIGASK